MKCTAIVWYRAWPSGERAKEFKVSVSDSFFLFLTSTSNFFDLCPRPLFFLSSHRYVPLLAINLPATLDENINSVADIKSNISRSESELSEYAVRDKWTRRRRRHFVYDSLSIC